MNEKLNLIYEKLLEIQSCLNEENYHKRLKELENEQKELTYKIEDLKYQREGQYRYNREMIDNFRSIDRQIQENDNHIPHID